MSDKCQDRDRTMGKKKARIHFLPQVDKMQNVRRTDFMNVILHSKHLLSWHNLKTDCSLIVSIFKD